MPFSGAVSRESLNKISRTILQLNPICTRERVSSVPKGLSGIRGASDTYALKTPKVDRYKII